MNYWIQGAGTEKIKNGAGTMTNMNRGVFRKQIMSLNMHFFQRNILTNYVKNLYE
jgi:hypothetical protein